MKNLEAHLPAQEISKYHVIIIAFNAGSTFINIAGAKGQFSCILVSGLQVQPVQPVC
jgi:hypothetical protein